MGYKLEKIANGLYIVCHRFGGWLVGLLSSCVHKVSQKRNLVNNRLYQRQTVRCQSNGNRASSVSDPPAPAAQTSTVGTACSRLTWPAVLPGRPHGPIILASLACLSLYSPTPPVIFRRRLPTSQPSYSPRRGQPLPCLPRLRVVPFVGLAIDHRPGALDAAWSMMSIQWP